jgi:spermidine synthase
VQVLRPLELVATVSTKEGELQLRRRSRRTPPDEFLITIDGRVLMASADRTSEQAVATLACNALVGRAAPRVLIGGLGMAYTLRAALDALPAAARVTVAELTAEVDTWCRGPLAPLTNGAVLDARVDVVIDDVDRVIGAAPAGAYDAIILDLYEGPTAVTKRDEPFYGANALARSYAALSPGGVLAVWSEDVNAGFPRRMTDAGFTTSVHRPGGKRAYGVYLGVRAAGIRDDRGTSQRSRPSRASRPSRPSRPSGR